MKPKTKPEKSILQQLRDIRDQVSAEIKDMTDDQLKAYLDRQRTLHPSRNWKNASRPKRKRTVEPKRNRKDATK